MSYLPEYWPFNIPPGEKIDICSPLVEGPCGPETFSQPALRGELPHDVFEVNPRQKER